MLQYANRDIKAQLKQHRQKSLTQIQHQTSLKFNATLHFMQEWTQDLMERENQLQAVRQQLIYSVSEGEAGKRKEEGGLDVQALIKEEFFSKMEDLYSKQLLVANMSQTDRMANEEGESMQDSLNHSVHDHTFSNQHEFEESSMGEVGRM